MSGEGLFVALVTSLVLWALIVLPILMLGGWL